mgnify:CR=1 FL=1
MSAAILVVDDESNVCLALTRILRENGFKVFAAESARQAFEIAFNEKLDLILLDIHLGELHGSKIDGLEICRTLKLDPRTLDVPIIMLTAHGDLQHVLASTKAGADDFVVKPWEMETLLAKIHKQLSPGQPPLPADLPVDEPQTPPRPPRRGSGLAGLRSEREE